MAKKQQSIDPETSSATSPVKTSVLMDFYSALRLVAQGYKVTKLEWNNPEEYGVLHDGKLYLHKSDNILYPWLISDGDLAGLDYETV